MLDDWRLFSPKLDDDGSAYASLMSAVVQEPKETAHRLNSIALRLAKLDNLKGARARAAALLLRDLVSMGWETKTEGGSIYLRPASNVDGSDKEAIRKQLEFGRNDQLTEPATRRFIMNLERPGRFSSCRSVTDLIVDGRRLAAQLAPIRALPREAREAALATVCQPYIQLVDGDARDEHTGIRLMDIWRYFRHNWATRYRSSPGRNLFYLIRDAAQPFHPVMGITALGNAVMQLGRRDNELGWTTEGLRKLITEESVTDSELLDAFQRRLLDDLSQIYLADMPLANGLPEVISDQLLDQLAIIEADATGLRADRLKQAEEDGVSEPRITDISEVDLESMARTPLFRAKRARAIREILRAYRQLKDAKSVISELSTSEGEWAISQALRQLKKAFSATAMMEITVCGGAPPYSGMLSGKLVCLMMMSRRITADYASRYDTGYSIIASQMAGRPIVKPPALVFLGTSSLYTQRSAQYNRVSLPANTIPGQLTAISFDEYGVSEGYGSPNLSTETEEALDQLTELTRNYRNVNFVFGEGQSPKLRQLREGFAALGLIRTNLLHHGMPRIVYGVHLARNSVRYLLGVDDKPDYCIPDGKDCDSQIAGYWRRRWLASRLDHEPALQALSQSTPLKERVSRLIHEVQSASQILPIWAGISVKERGMASVAQESEKTAFIRRLYRDQSAYSDEVPVARLRELNVRTPLDDVVRKIVRAGGSAVITGNAGDGKTHTIRLLESDLKAANADYILDASAVTQDEVIARWDAARAEGRPFCIAINEGPLIELIRAHSEGRAWLEDLRQQLLRLVTYVSTESEEKGKFVPKPGATVVIDLSLRRTLAPDLIKRTLNKITEDTWYSTCPYCGSDEKCPVTYNRKMLREERVQQRLVDLLQHVAERGLRATFRELLAFCSYLIFAGKTCAELQKGDQNDQSLYFWNAFEGQGAIFESLEHGLDPVRQTDARIDEKLWRGKFAEEDFLGHRLQALTARDLDEARDTERQFSADSFAALKRRWYFEHSEGRLGQLTQTDKLFRELQDSNLSPQLRVGRLIALINEKWNRADKDQQDKLRLWTRLSYSPRANGKAMVSGRDVSNLRLGLFRPQIAPALRHAFGEQAIDHLLLAPPDNVRFASLVVDRKLLSALLHSGGTERGDVIDRRLASFNDALAQYAEVGSHVRTIELLDPTNELSVKLRVDLSQRRYDSAQ